MWFVFGAKYDLVEMGQVAELCPHCGQLSPCSLLCSIHTAHVYFVTFHEGITEVNCQCHACGGQFSFESSRYRNVAPSVTGMNLEALIEWTNPCLKEVFQWDEQKRNFADDAGFVGAEQAIERLWPGRLRNQLQAELRQWGRLSEGERLMLQQRATESARAVQFAELMASRLPGAAGCLPACLACMAVWSAFLWTAAGRYLLWSLVLVFGGIVVAAITLQLCFNWSPNRWVKGSIIREGEKENIDFERLATILEDLFGRRQRVPVELAGLKQHAAEILETLAVFGKISKESHT